MVNDLNKIEFVHNDTLNTSYITIGGNNYIINDECFSLNENERELENYIVMDILKGNKILNGANFNFLIKAFLNYTSNCKNNINDNILDTFNCLIFNKNFSFNKNSVYKKELYKLKRISKTNKYNYDYYFKYDRESFCINVDFKKIFTH